MMVTLKKSNVTRAAYVSSISRGRRYWGPVPEVYSLRTIIKFLLNSFITLQVFEKRILGFLESLHAQGEDFNLFLLF